MDNDTTIINIEKKILESWHNKLCVTELKIINAENIMSVIREIEAVILGWQKSNINKPNENE